MKKYKIEELLYLFKRGWGQENEHSLWKGNVAWENEGSQMKETAWLHLDEGFI